jgi:hypothetical protein
MAADGKSAPGSGGSGGSGTQAAEPLSGHGNLPSPDGKEPSGLPFDDGKPMASDGSRAPAHRAIPNGIASRDPNPNPEGQNLTATQERRRGTRIPDDFAVDADMVAWARKRVPQVDGRTETEKFMNHFRAKSGRDATKLDWVLTWKNWMLNAAERAGRASPPPPPPGASPRPEFMERR